MLKNLSYTKITHSDLATMDECSIFLDYLKQCDYPYLKDWYKINIYFNEDMRLECNGAFSIYYRNNIFLTSAFRGDLKRLTATLGHEMLHRQQYIKYGYLYILACAPLIRQYTIEVPAEAMEKHINTILKIDENYWL